MAGSLEIEAGLDAVPAVRCDRWGGLVCEAEQSRPRDFNRNGWVVHALQGAWSAIHHAGVAVLETGAPRATALCVRLEHAVRGGRNTDTVAAIAGGMLGAVYGASALPAAWRRKLHGWPDLDTRGLTELGVLAVRGGESDGTGWPVAERLDYVSWGPREALVAHPHDPGLFLGSIVDLEAALSGSADVTVGAEVAEFQRALGLTADRDSITAKRWGQALGDVRDRVVQTGSAGVGVAKNVGDNALNRARMLTHRLANGIAEKTRSDGDAEDVEQENS